MGTLGRYLSKKTRKAYRYATVRYKTSVGALRHPKMVFVWIPKTAGTSLFTALESEVGMVNLCKSMGYAKTFRNRGAVTFGHFDYKALVKEGIVSEQFDHEAFKFCVVRNPYDRALSLYYYLKRIGRCSNGLAEFLDDVARERPPIGLYNALGISQANPQVDWIVDDNGDFVVDAVYRFEQLEKMRDDLCQRLQLPDLDIGHENRTSREQAAEDALASHPEVMPLIETIYARDFELLGYAKHEREK